LGTDRVLYRQPAIEPTLVSFNSKLGLHGFVWVIFEGQGG
jgi:hypothetical protein